MLFGAVDVIEIYLQDVSSRKRQFRAKLSKEAIIGQSSCSLTIPDDRTISRKHARLTLKEGRVYIKDLHSTNGTWLNREKLTGTMELCSGDVLRLGDSEFEVKLCM